MKKHSTLLLFLIVTCAAFAQEEGAWTTQNIPDATRYDDVFFIDKNVGWTAGGWNKKVHKTTNGGQTWTEAGLIGNNKYLRSIEFFDANVGLCGSLNGSLYRTTNGGATWTDVAPTISPQPLGVCGLAKADASTMYGVGIWSEPAFVIKSINKGLNWVYIDMSTYATSLIDVYFFDANHGFVVGSVSEEDGGVILYTADGGETWVEKFRTNHVEDRIWKIQTPDNVHFFASIESSVDETRMLRSADAGQTWEMITVDPEYSYIQVVGFIDSLRGWTGGNETLYETTDGGDTWEKISLGSTYNRFFKVSEGLAFMTGRKVYTFTRDVITGIIDPEPYDPIHRITVSPNPTTGKAIAHITFGNPTLAHIYLYNTTGKVMKKLFDGAVTAGEKTVNLDLTDHGAESYLVIVKTNEGMISTNVLKQ